jgi:peroxiredoxin
MIAVSPQTQRQNAFTAERHNLTFPILSDPGANVAAQFGLAYTVPEPTRGWYRSMLVNIPFLNGDDSWRLPLPATFVVDQTGTILFSQATADHRLRPEPEAVLTRLRASGRAKLPSSAA